MIIGLILLMAERQTGIVQHVIIGVVMFLIFIVHNVCNLSWWSYLGKGSCSPSRLRGTICNILLAIDLLVVMGSGFFNATGVHHISVLCFLILVVIHIIFRVKNNFEKGNGKQEWYKSLKRIRWYGIMIAQSAIQGAMHLAPLRRRLYLRPMARKVNALAGASFSSRMV